MADKVRTKVLALDHCPTEDMLVDFFTKPLQGYCILEITWTSDRA